MAARTHGSIAELERVLPTDSKRRNDHTPDPGCCEGHEIRSHPMQGQSILPSPRLALRIFFGFSFGNVTACYSRPLQTRVVLALDPTMWG